MTPRLAVAVLLALEGLTPPARLTAAEPAKPNIVYVLADDFGYGDAACYNPQSKIPTPHIDRLAKEGTRFTDAHSGSAITSASLRCSTRSPVRHPWSQPVSCT
jgi:hypothetical protein